jgi:alanyl-tRNA synthetase
MTLFEQELKNSTDKFCPKIAFKLYDTYGFPIDLTQDMLREKNIQLDVNEFNKLMQEQKDRAKASWKGSGDSANEGNFQELINNYKPNKFIGYENTSSTSKIVALFDENFKIVDSLNSDGWIMLDNTPFYATSGGQIGDIGEIIVDNNSSQITKTEKFFGFNLSQVKP